MRNSLEIRLTILAVTMIALTLAIGGADRMTTARVIVQGGDATTVAKAVRQVGGEVTHELGIINAVGARLTADQRRALEDDAFRVMADRDLSVAGASKKIKSSKKITIKVVDDLKWQGAEKRSKTVAKAWEASEKRAAKIASEWEKAAEKATKAAEEELAKMEKEANRAAIQQARAAARDARGWEKTLKEWNKEWAKDAFLRGTKPTFFTGLIGATALHEEGITGRGVSIAIVDTGLGRDVGLRQTSRGDRRVLASYDAQNDTLLSGWEIRKGNDGKRARHTRGGRRVEQPADSRRPQRRRARCESRGGQSVRRAR